MNSRTPTTDKGRRTTKVPVTTMEEIPVLSEEERTQLQRSLKEAEQRVARGEAADYNPATFKDRLISLYRSGKRS